MKLNKLDDIIARCNVCFIEPESYEETAQDEAWKKAMENEMEMIEKNET